MINNVGNKRLIVQSSQRALRRMLFHVKYYALLCVLLLSVVVSFSIIPDDASADVPVGYAGDPSQDIDMTKPLNPSFTDPRCVGYSERNLKAISTPVTVVKGNGFDIINGTFEAVNLVMTDMAKTFYTAITDNTAFSDAVNALCIVYIAVYGILIMYGHAPARAGEIISRLIKVGLLWSIIAPHGVGWNFFSTYIGNPAIDIMNQLIQLFVAAGNAGGAPVVIAGNGSLSPISLNMIAGSMNMVLSMRFVIGIIALIFTGPFGWFFALVILWSLVQFLLMVIGAIITYVKAIVALSFMFALAPIFFAFILFEKTRQIFMQWANQVFGFMMQPILLFGFLGFYAAVLTNILSDILFGTDYCWVFFFSFSIFDIPFWRPIAVDPNTSICLDINHCQGGDWDGPPPMHIMDIFYFLLLTHLGKNLSKFIESMSKDLTGGYSGAGVVRGSQVGDFMANHLPGVKGRGPMDLLGDGFQNVKHKAQAWNKGRSDKNAARPAMGTTRTSPSTGGQGGGDQGGGGGKGADADWASGSSAGPGGSGGGGPKVTMPTFGSSTGRKGPGSSSSSSGGGGGDGSSGGGTK